MNIGFWNINSFDNNKDLSNSLVSLTLEKQLDIICIAEIKPVIVDSFLKKLNNLGTNQKYTKIKSCKDKVTVISRYPNTVFEDKSSIYESNRWITHKISIPSIITFNLISVHFPSKVNWSEAGLALECVNLSRDISKIEDDTKCSETILIGDFNMNPFEHGLVAASGINALVDLNYAVKKSKGREINGTHYKYFYNPMWNFFGDFTEPYGTHYCRVPGHISHEWHIYDQIILRPSLEPYLKRPFVEIVAKIYNENLTKNFGRPDSENYSDHLPIVLKLKL